MFELALNTRHEETKKYKNIKTIFGEMLFGKFKHF